eukprot:3362504-Amphidinium_carterae.1
MAEPPHETGDQQCVSSRNSSNFRSLGPWEKSNGFTTGSEYDRNIRIPQLEEHRSASEWPTTLVTDNKGVYDVFKREGFVGQDRRGALEAQLAQ